MLAWLMMVLAGVGVASVANQTRSRRLSRLARRAGLVAIVALAITPALGSPTTGHRRCTFINTAGHFAPVVDIYRRRHVSCAQAKDVVRDYIQQVRPSQGDLVIDCFRVHRVTGGRYAATRPADHARFVWLNYGTV
jgi:hypothetical protein